MGISDPTDKQPSCNEFVAATNLGINDHYLRTLLSLVEAPKEVKELIEEKKIDTSTAGEIAYRLKERPEKAVEVVKKVAKAEKNRRELARRLVKEVTFNGLCLSAKMRDQIGEWQIVTTQSQLDIAN